MSESYNEDHMIGMANMPDKFIDWAIVDIEYGIGASKPSEKNKVVKQKNGSNIGIKQNNYVHKEWDFQKSSEVYFKELFRVSKNQIIFGGNYYGLAGGYLVWDKLNGESDQYGCELAWLSFTKRMDKVYYMWAGMMQGAYCGKDVRKALVQQGDKSLNEKRIHPTQKPVKLYKWTLGEYVEPGSKILDTHQGSGSLRIAAYDMGFDYYGYEKEKDYYDDSETRFRQFKSQPKLFQDI